MKANKWIEVIKIVTTAVVSIIATLFGTGTI